MHERISGGLCTFIVTLFPHAAAVSDASETTMRAPDEQEFHDRIGKIGRSAKLSLSTDLV